LGVTDTIDVAAPTAAVSKVEENIKPVAVVEVAAAGNGARLKKAVKKWSKAVFLCAMQRA